MKYTKEDYEAVGKLVLKLLHEENRLFVLKPNGTLGKIKLSSKFMEGESK